VRVRETEKESERDRECERERVECLDQHEVSLKCDERDL
jgi:hypothetical protein